MWWPHCRLRCVLCFLHLLLLLPLLYVRAMQECAEYVIETGTTSDKLGSRESSEENNEQRRRVEQRRVRQDVCRSIVSQLMA